MEAPRGSRWARAPSLGQHAPVKHSPSPLSPPPRPGSILSMASPRAWSQLAQLPPTQLNQLTDRRLAAHMREELLPFSPWLASAAVEAGLGPRDLRRSADLGQLPTSSLADFAESPAPFDLIPDPRRLRELWPFGRKLALSLAGKKGGRLLRHAYDPVDGAPIPVGDGQVWLRSTARCLEVAGEVGARALAILGLDSAGSTVVLASPIGNPARTCWTAARTSAGVLVHDTGGPKSLDAEATAERLRALKATGLIAEPPFAQAVLEAGAKKGLRHLRVVALANYRLPPDRKAELREHARSARAEEAQVCNVLDLAATRLLFPEAPAEPDESSGYVLSPDLAHFEVLDDEGGQTTEGELTFTTSSQRGTALVRYRLGLIALDGITRRACPHTGRTLPRLQPALQRKR